MRTAAEELFFLARIHAVLSGDLAAEPLTDREVDYLIERIAWARKTMQTMTPAERQTHAVRFRKRFLCSGSDSMERAKDMSATEQSIQCVLLANLEACAKVQAELAVANARMAAALAATWWREPMIAIILVAVGLVLGLLAR